MPTNWEGLPGAGWATRTLECVQFVFKAILVQYLYRIIKERASSSLRWNDCSNQQKERLLVSTYVASEYVMYSVVLK